MEIDWFTLAAQIVNFLVLVFLLQHFLFSRVTGAMDERERRIGSRLDEAEQKRREAQEHDRQLQEQQRKLEESRERMMARARKEAEQQRGVFVDQARREVSGLRKRWQQAVEQQRRAFLAGLRDQVGREIVRTTRDVLEDLASSDLESRTVETFVRYVKGMGRQELERLRSFLQGAGGQLEIRSSFDLPDRARKQVAEVLEEASGLDLRDRMQFERSPALLLGIELRADGKSVGWNLDRYLDILAERLEDMLSSRAGGTSPPVEESREEGSIPERDQANDQKGSDRDGE